MSKFKHKSASKLFGLGVGGPPPHIDTEKVMCLTIHSTFQCQTCTFYVHYHYSFIFSIVVLGPTHYLYPYPYAYPDPYFYPYRYPYSYPYLWPYLFPYPYPCPYPYCYPYPYPYP